MKELPSTKLGNTGVSVTGLGGGGDFKIAPIRAATSNTAKGTESRGQGGDGLGAWSTIAACDLFQGCMELLLRVRAYYN